MEQIIITNDIICHWRKYKNTIICYFNFKNLISHIKRFTIVLYINMHLKTI